MQTEQQKRLVTYLVDNNFATEDYAKLLSLISGMTAGQIIEAMEQAKQLQKELSSTGLGRELL